MTCDLDVVGMDWVKSDPRPKGTHPLGWGLLFVTSRLPNRLIKWAETSMEVGLDPGTGIACVSQPSPIGSHAPLVGVAGKHKNAVFRLSQNDGQL